MDAQKPHPSHFRGKEAIEHVAETQAEGLLSGLESHALEAKPHLSAACNAATEISFVLSLFILLTYLFTVYHPLFQLIIFATGYIIWRTAKSAYLGWQRLEKFHRLIAEEKWEIEHHRTQERDELVALYGAKGFEGRLLDEVVDVLMSDEDRLLRVMIEEELNLRLENQEHPLKEAFGALIGSSLVALIILTTYALSTPIASICTALFLLGSFATAAAYYAKNQCIRAAIWALSIGVLCLIISYFLFELFKS